MYKESFYNLVQEHEGNLIIYNTKTGAVGIVPKEEANMYTEALKHPEDKKYQAQVEVLVQQNFLVSEEINELEEIRKWHERALNFPNYIQITMLPNENCNFACPYCFIYTHRDMVMTDTVYDSVLKYIENVCRDSEETTYLTLIWFGGEPLLAKNKIVEFMKKLENLKEQYPLTIESSIVTNGYLLTAQVFQELLDAGIYGYQVTIDGYPETHNKLRPLKNGEPTFDVIYQNLKDVLCNKGNYQFAIRVNFLKDRQEELNAFADQLLADFGDDDRFKLYFRPIYYFETSRDDIKQIQDRICDGHECVEIQNQLEFKIMEKRGNVGNRRIADPLPMPALSWCGTEWFNACTIGADGSIFFCDTMADQKHGMGRITEEGKLEIKEGFEIWKKSVFEEKETMKGCFECKLLPICLGGCRRNRIETGKPDCYWTEDEIRKAMIDYCNVNMKQI